MSSYTDQAAVEGYLGTALNVAQAANIATWITAMSAHIESATGRVFVADASASARLFEGNLSNKMLIDDCVEVTLVHQGDLYGDNFTTIAAPDYQLLPYNGLPKNAVGLKRTTWGIGIHRITAKWGYSVACPTDIKLAATILVAGIATAYTRTGTTTPKKSETIGNYSVSFMDDKSAADFERACAIIESYRRITL